MVCSAGGAGSVSASGAATISRPPRPSNTTTQAMPSNREASECPRRRGGREGRPRWSGNGPLVGGDLRAVEVVQADTGTSHAASRRGRSFAGCGGIRKGRKRPTGRFRSTRRSAFGADRSHDMQAFRSFTRTATRTEDTTTVSCTRATNSLAIPPATRESSRHAGFRRLIWRDPDSNRGHHDFQSCALPTELSRRARTG